MLNGCDKKGVQRLIIPAIGTGKWGLPGEQVAELMYEAIDSFFRSNLRTSLQKITLAVDSSERSTYRVSSDTHSILIILNNYLT